ncbi:T9SS type A sorting domain-containing protein [Flavisericum labens]|uniref:T9SS type A sorting domain-containing protein n=1 Tax=Flavisericum labens TaxID=3377112 RepID=UPI00387B61DE
MKEKVHNDSPNLILKTLTFVLIFFLGTSGLVVAQNANANENATVFGGEFTFLDGETYNSICIDGEADYVMVEFVKEPSGRLKQWIITDEEGYIVGLPDNISDVNFDEAEVGICLIYHLSYNGMKPLVDPSGQGKFKLHISEVTEKGEGKGRSDLSEPIMIERFLQPTPGILEGGPFEFCVGDGEADHIPDGAITLSGNSSTNEAWVVTDPDLNILGLPPTPYDVNFDEAPAGTCLVWHLGYEDNVSFDGVTNTADLVGCYELSNPITVNRYTQPTPGILEGGPFEFCVGDGVVDNIPDGAITLSGNSSTNEAWVVTDSDGNILGLPPTPYDVNFDEAPAGTCLVWHLGYEDNVSFEGVENAADLMGCYALSNAITVNRFAQPTAGILEGGPFEFCVGDGMADNIPDGAIALSGNISTNEAWLVTDDAGNILQLPSSPYDVNFDEAPAGTCLVWHLGYEDNVSFDGVENAADLMGCYALSNPITVNRFAQPTAGVLEGGPFEFCVGDEVADNIPDGAIALSGNISTNEAWVVTDDAGNILQLPSSPYEVNFDEAPAGTCLVWHLGYENNVSFDGVENAADLMGCYALSNPITVNRFEQPTAGVLEGGPFEFCVGDGEADNIADGAITLSGNMGTNSAWVVTDADGNILGLPESPYSVDFEDAVGGTCLVWHLSYEDNVSFEGVENAADLMGCFALSNSISVVRTEVDGGTITGGTDNSFSFTVGDGTEDKIPADSITLEGNVGANSAWVVTNEDGTIILGLPDNYSDVDFDGAEAGICKVWHMSYEDGLTGTEPPAEGDHLVSSLNGCFSLSNAITINRTTASSRSVALYPNPTKKSVSVDLTNFSGDEVNISLYNINNSRLYNRDLIFNGVSKKQNLDLSRFGNGIYFIRVTDLKTGTNIFKRLVVK